MTDEPEVGTGAAYGGGTSVPASPRLPNRRGVPRAESTIGGVVNIDRQSRRYRTAVLDTSAHFAGNLTERLVILRTAMTGRGKVWPW